MAKRNGEILLEAFKQWNEETDSHEYISSYHNLDEIIDEYKEEVRDKVCLDGDFNLEKIAEIFIEKLNK